MKAAVAQTFIPSFILFLMLYAVPVKAQQISYAYDDSGNRKIRQKVISMPSPVKSAEAVPESTEEDNTAGYEDYVAEAKITIFPNPTRGNLRIDINGMNIPKESKIYLYNISGKMVIQLNEISESNSTVWNIIKE